MISQRIDTESVGLKLTMRSLVTDIRPMARHRLNKKWTSSLWNSVAPLNAISWQWQASARYVTGRSAPATSAVLMSWLDRRERV